MTADSATPSPGSDPHRLVAAVHELGHALVWRAVGFDIDEIWVRGQGASTHGHVWLTQTDDDIRTVDHEHAVQVGLLAGRVAQHRWCQDTSIAIESSCATDETLYRIRRRSRLGRRVNRSTVEADARRLVTTHWGAITRLTPVLAESGRLTPGRLPTVSSRITTAR